MKENELRDLFQELIAPRGSYKELGVDPSTISEWKKKPPTLGTQLEILLRHKKIIIHDARGTTA